MDKSAKPQKNPKGAEYCNKKGTSCYYGKDDICVNCGRTKGWRKRFCGFCQGICTGNHYISPSTNGY